MTTISKTLLNKQVFQMVNILTQDQLVQVLNFMKFLKTQEKQDEEEQEDSFLDFIMQDASSDVTLEQVRKELSSIKGNLSDIITQEREERV